MASRDPRNRYRWDPRAAQYRSLTTGKFIDRKTVRVALDRAVDGEALEMASNLKKLSTGSLTLDAWYAAMRQSIKMVHLWAAAAAKGGWAQLTAGDYGYIGSTVRFHYDRLAKFAQQLSLGLPITPREVIRVGMYAQAARATYHAIELDVTMAAGYDEELNVLDENAEHCSDCVSLALMGWQPIGTLPMLGTLTCLTNDRCSREFRRSGGRP